METNVKHISVATAGDQYRASIIGLLNSEKLPVDDLPSHLDDFLLAREGDQVVGAVGLEKYDKYGLLRSLVVGREHRNKNIAGKLINQLESQAASSGLQEMYLLTETAPDYFLKKGYLKITREEVPAPVKQSSEFTHTCPVSAVVMKKVLHKN